MENITTADALLASKQIKVKPDDGVKKMRIKISKLKLDRLEETFEPVQPISQILQLSETL